MVQFPNNQTSPLYVVEKTPEFKRSNFYDEEFKKRFWSKVAPQQRAEDCLFWTGAVGADGYGVLRLGGRIGGKQVPAHLIAWELQTETEIPEYWRLKNLCGHRNCLNRLHWKPFLPARYYKAVQGTFKGVPASTYQKLVDRNEARDYAVRAPLTDAQTAADNLLSKAGTLWT